MLLYELVTAVVNIANTGTGHRPSTPIPIGMVHTILSLSLPPLSPEFYFIPRGPPRTSNRHRSTQWPPPLADRPRKIPSMAASRRVDGFHRPFPGPPGFSVPL